MSRSALWTLTGLSLALGLIGCGEAEPPPSSATSAPAEVAASSPGDQKAGPDSALGSPAIPQPDMTDMEEVVAKRLRETREAVVRQPDSAAAWGRFGMVAHAHELWSEAETAYRQAQRLDLEDPRWPYFLGDVMSVVGTDLDGAAKAFRRSLDLRPGYAPSHMRLGKVLIAEGRGREAAKELRRALEISPDLQPARVALAQVELAEGKLKSAEQKLDRVLKAAPRHAQALSTLGQIYMRQGRRDQARQIARRARGAAIYNLYSDPMMGEVVNEGVSSVLIWERAKAFLDNGDYEQAAVGLEQVAGQISNNADLHQQLAMAYRNLEQPSLAVDHLEKALGIRDDLVEPRVQLGWLLLDYQKPAEALPHLERAVKLAPQDPDAGWLLGRAKVLLGDLRPGIKLFEAEEAKAQAAGRSVPAWVHNDWGSALAQTGRPLTALEHFERALELDPDDPQSLFYAGLVHEGRGDRSTAHDYYCRSMKAQPNPPAANRLRAMGKTCNI